MIARRLRLLAALLGLAAVLAIPVGPAVAQDDGTGPPTTPDGDEAIDDLVGCVQGSRNLLVLFMIDESASLKQTDPDDRRVDAARSALDSLVALATGEGEGSPEVTVSLAAFANDFRTVTDWTTVTEGSAAGLEESLEGFADLEDGIGTDFVTALAGARESLAGEAATVTADGGATPCRALLVFTDGGYDIAVRESAEDQEELGLTKPYAPDIELTTPEAVTEAEAQGRAALCDPGGLADQLRGDQVTLLTVALSSDVARRAQYPLAAATAGIADDYTCGSPTERAPGAYLPAEGIDVLITRFNEVGTRLAGGNLVPGDDQVQLCESDGCGEGSRTFQLDPTLRRAQVVALAPEPGALLVLESPTGVRLRLDAPGTTEAGAVEVRTRALADRGLAVDLIRPAELGDWTGEWSASLVDPSGEQAGEEAILQVFVFSDLGVDFGQGEALVRGESSELVASLVVPEGVDPAAIVATAEAVIRFEDPITGRIDTVELSGPPEGPYTGTFTTPADLTANALTGTVEVRMTTTGGAALVSQSAAREQPVLRPGASIQFAPASLKMPSLTGTGTTSTELVLIGGDSDGCVWFGDATVPEPPQGAGEVTLALDTGPLPGEADCIPVAAGDRVTVVVEAGPEDRASGTVAGSVQVFERVDGAEATTTDLSFRFDLARGVDEARRLLLAALMLVGGLALPLVVLMIINAATARFQRLSAVRGAAIPVRVDGDEIARIDGQAPRPLVLRTGDFESMAATGDDRSFRFGGVEFRARASRNPFGGTIALAAPEGGAQKLKGHAGSRVELDPGLAGSWVFLLDSDATRRSGRTGAVGLLIAFVAEGEFGRQSEKLKADVDARLPSTAARLSGLLAQVKTKPKASKRRGRRGDAADEPEATEATGEADEHEAEAPPIEEPAPDAGVTSDPAGDEASPDEPAPAPEAPEAPAAPTGFGGAAGAGVDLRDRPVSGGDGPDDDGPSAPPVGFGGGRPG